MRVLLVECILPTSKPRIDEVNDIAKAAGYNVVGEIVQRRDSIDSAVGRGMPGGMPPGMGMM